MAGKPEKPGGKPDAVAEDDKRPEQGEENEPEGLDEGLDLDCPTCGEIQPHHVLRAAASGWTVQCLECRTPHTLPAPPQPRSIEVPVILSEGAASKTKRLHVPLDGPVRPNDEYDLDGQRIRITAVEVAAGRRPRSAPGRNIKVVYAVAFDTVALDYTLNEGEVTRSFREQVVPEQEVHIGTVREVQGVRLVVKTLKSDQNRTIHRGFLLARNVRRVFADRAGPKARPGSRARVRKRGPPPGVKGEPRNRIKRPGPARARRR